MRAAEVQPGLAAGRMETISPPPIATIAAAIAATTAPLLAAAGAAALAAGAAAFLGAGAGAAGAGGAAGRVVCHFREPSFRGGPKGRTRNP